MRESSVNQPGKTVFVAGASGTIGRAVVRALVEDGHRVIAQVRSPQVANELAGAETFVADLSDEAELAAHISAFEIETLVSCIASRSGAPMDAMAVDYAANQHLLSAAETAGAGHFILLSAICVQRPMLAFQHAKLKFESALRSSAIDHTIVRPTAFFKSLSGQVARVAKGKSFMVFEHGELTRCKPISDCDLARFIALCVTDAERRGQTLPIGGPGPAISPLDQRAMLSQLLGRKVGVRPIALKWLTRMGGVLDLAARTSPLARGWFEEKAQYLKIAHYYATESMLVLDPETGDYSDEMTPEFGEERLMEHYAQLIEDALIEDALIEDAR